MEVALGYFEDEGDAVKYDLTKPAMSGIDYLKRVQIEAANCPDIVSMRPKIADTVDDNDASMASFDDTSSITDSKLDDKHEIPRRKLPPEKLQLRIAEDFTFLRQKLNRVRSDPSLCRVKKTAQVPSVGNIQVLSRFCYGKEFTAQYLDATLKCTKAKTINAGANGQGNAPLLGTLLRLKSVAVNRLLKINLSLMDTLGFSYDQGVWVYALLLCLDKPMPSGVCSTIRDMCRRVINIRNAALDEAVDENVVHQLNLIVVLVTRCFGQTDLLEDAQDLNESRPS